MTIHVAILKPLYVDLILRGRKTVESRLYRTTMPPMGLARVGERVYFKKSGGPFAAIARIAAVDEYTDLTPQKVRELARQYNETVCGDADYWQAKRDSRCAAFIALSCVESMDVGPTYTKSMRAWHVLDDRADVICEYEITGGALRNRYAHLPNVSNQLKKNMFNLQLPDGQRIETDLTNGKMIRWRGWGRYYERYQVHAGDRVRFVCVGKHQYRVSFIHAS